jgi:hypothetical protein
MAYQVVASEQALLEEYKRDLLMSKKRPTNELKRIPGSCFGEGSPGGVQKGHLQVMQISFAP